MKYDLHSIFIFLNPITKPSLFIKKKTVKAYLVIINRWALYGQLAKVHQQKRFGCIFVCLIVVFSQFVFINDFLSYQIDNIY